MDAETYKFILGAAGVLIMVLLGIVGFFMQKHITVIEELVKAVNGLNTTVTLLKSDQENSSENCSALHSIINKRLNAHSQKISETQIGLEKLKTKVELEHP
jgi:hypothetical protein